MRTSLAAPAEPGTGFTPTLFDRLCEKAEPSSAKGLRQIVLRDLSILLNTVNHGDSLDLTRRPGLGASALNYGVDALAGRFRRAREWSELELLIARAVNDFEPRLLPGSLCVRPRSSAASNNLLDLQISGVIRARPQPLDFDVVARVDLENSRMVFVTPEGAVQQDRPGCAAD